MSRYTGYKPNNASSGLKHWGIHEDVGRPLVDDVDWAVAPVEQAVWLVLEIFNNNGGLVDCYWKSVDIERNNSSCIVSLWFRL